MDSYQVSLILSLFVMIMVTRGLPFLFAKHLAQNMRFQAVGKQLPAYIMLLLVIYEINPATFLTAPFGLPAIAALAILLIVHCIFRQLLFSLAVGTLCYVLLLNFLVT